MKYNTIYTEIRDEYGDIASCSFCDTLAEAIRWFREHGIKFADVRYDLRSGEYSYTYRPIDIIIQ